MKQHYRLSLFVCVLIMSVLLINTTCLAQTVETDSLVFTDTLLQIIEDTGIPYSSNSKIDVNCLGVQMNTSSIMPLSDGEAKAIIGTSISITNHDINTNEVQQYTIISVDELPVSIAMDYKTKPVDYYGKTGGPFDIKQLFKLVGSCSYELQDYYNPNNTIKYVSPRGISFYYQQLEAQMVTQIDVGLIAQGEVYSGDTNLGYRTEYRIEKPVLYPTPLITYSNSTTYDTKLGLTSLMEGDGLFYGIEWWADGNHGAYTITIEGV